MACLCLHAICPKGTGYMFIDLDLAVFWLWYSHDLLQPFLDERNGSLNEPNNDRILTSLQTTTTVILRRSVFSTSERKGAKQM